MRALYIVSLQEGQSSVTSPKGRVSGYTPLKSSSIDSDFDYPTNVVAFSIIVDGIRDTLDPIHNSYNRPKMDLTFCFY